MRTTGSVEPYTDLKIKHRIDAGLMPGPALDASAPYLEGPHTSLPRCTSSQAPKMQSTSSITGPAKA